MKTVGLFVGSLRQASFSKKIAEFIVENTPENYLFKIIPIGQLPLYNQDFDEDDKNPQTYTEFRTIVKGLDALLFITPEYNRSLPAVLKNAIDVGSRPGGKSVWDGKPGAVISSSMGSIGGFGAAHHLRQSLAFLNIPTLAQPEVYLSKIQDSFDSNGKLTDERTAKFLLNFLHHYILWVEKIIANPLQ